MAGIEPVMFKGMEIIPIEFLKAVLPDPGELGENYTGQTSIGCRIRASKTARSELIMFIKIAVTRPLIKKPALRL